MVYLLGIPFLATVATAAVTQGSFNTLSLNVAGLPAFLSSGNPRVNTPLISSRLGPYDLIHVQEDFNHHSALYASDTHAFRTPTSGGVPFGSGLNTLSSFPYTDLDRTTWSKCYINDGDCLTPKGFTFMRVKISEGVLIDAYNVHADAGSATGDATARASNMAQLAEYINTVSAGMPILVFGDTNTLYTRAGDSTTLSTFLSSTSTTDAWVSLVHSGVAPVANTDCPFPFPAGTSQAQQNGCEIVDKLFVRSSAAVTLSASSYTNVNDAFLDTSGEPLSDHYPITSTISWTLSSVIRMGDASGGTHGTYFNDIPTLFADHVPQLSSITLRGGNRVDAVEYSVMYSTATTALASHGGTGGTATMYTLAPSERVTSMTACWGKVKGNTRVFSLALDTSTGRTFAAGVTTGDCLTSRVPTDDGADGKVWGLVGFYGRAGDEMDNLAPIWGAGY